jgi:hypothetical protein
MGRTYAGILGPLAFATVLIRGLILVDGAAATLKLAMICLFVFAIVGLVIGRVAETTVLESVKIKIGKEMQASKDEAAAEAS